MAIVALPADPIPFVRSTFDLVRGDATLEYPTGARQVTAPPKAVWRATWLLPLKRGADLRAWRAALVQLSTQANGFTQRPPGFAGPSTGYSGPAPLVKGAGQLGKTLICDGVTASDPIVKAGDFISVLAAGKRELKQATADASSDVGGNVTFGFEPALRNAPADNATVEIFTPLAEFALDEPLSSAALDAVLNGQLAIEASETFAP